MVIFREVPCQRCNVAHLHFQPLQSPFAVTPMEPSTPDSDGEALGPAVRLLHAEHDATGRTKKKKKKEKKGGRQAENATPGRLLRKTWPRCSRSRRLLLATGVHSRGAGAGGGGRWMVSRAADELPRPPALCPRLYGRAACGSRGRGGGFVPFPRLPCPRPAPEPDAGLLECLNPLRSFKPTFNFVS